MDIDNSRAQLLVNRVQLAELYDKLTVYKIGKRQFDEAGYTTLEYSYHNRIKGIMGDIARLVVLQKALKADIAKAIKYQRFVADFKKRTKERRMITAAKWAAEYNTAKLDAMNELSKQSQELGMGYE